MKALPHNRHPAPLHSITNLPYDKLRTCPHHTPLLPAPSPSIDTWRLPLHAVPSATSLFPPPPIAPLFSSLLHLKSLSSILFTTCCHSGFRPTHTTPIKSSTASQLPGGPAAGLEVCCKESLSLSLSLSLTLSAYPLVQTSPLGAVDVDKSPQ
jgi:hypothetical protein